MGASHQDVLPGRYRPWVMGLSMAAFALAFVAWLNESWLYLFDNPVRFNRYTEYVIILIFGLWRIRAEHNPYTRRRLIILVCVLTGFWWLIPWLMPMFEPYVGYVWIQPVFPSLHTPGTLTFFLVLALVFLFGRRVICGFACPCVGIRETVGFPFRRATLRSDWAWRLRHSKWFFFIWYVGVMAATQFPPNAWSVTLVGLFALVVGLTYFGSFFIAPITGNRFYCRYLCPYGATFGLLNHAGFYELEMDPGKCVDCGRCEQACDMGIPVWQQGKTQGRVTGLEDCMGCARCVVSCPTDALEIRDLRNIFRPSLRQDASHLLRRAPGAPSPREGPGRRPAALRRKDWNEAEKPFSTEKLMSQARRCLDCGSPGCRNACPLGNRIPDWLASAGRGDWISSGELVHSNSPLPELCGTICPQHLLCESACTRGRLEGAVNIGAIERGVAEIALDSGWRPGAPLKRSGRRVAVVGAGPAGLACAELLNREGVEVVVYDRGSSVGGLLFSGIPSFKLDKALLARRQALLTGAGVIFQLGRSIGGEAMRELTEQNDAVFLALGAQQPRQVELPGQELCGVAAGLSWLADCNLRRGESLLGKRVLTLGGGDTAMDCARAALRLGASATIAYRGPEHCLRAAPKEVASAREEGVAFLFEHQVKQVHENPRGLQVDFDTPTAARTLTGDRVIIAFGQQPCPPAWLADFLIETEADGRIRVTDGGRTSNPRVWAGGDNTHGPDLAVTAMAAGRQAARDMLKDLESSALRFPGRSS